jgi:very-short-patch-repair endonuclease
LIDLVQAHSLPTPALNAWVAGHEVDALWDEERLIVELDGYEFHRTRASFERDRRRDEDLQLAGYDVVRLTWSRLEREAENIARRLRRHLAAATTRTG